VKPARPCVPEEHAGLVGDVTALAEENAGLWFGPSFERRRPSVSVVSFSVRPRCFLYRFTVTSQSVSRQIVAKVRHSDPRHRRTDRFAGRPELTPHRILSDSEAAHLEYVGLNQIAAALDGSDPHRFGVLRALGELPDRATVVMEFVDQPTLRQLVMRSRAQPRQRVQRMRGPARDSVWTALGEWLRRFHAAHPGESLAGRMTSTDDLAGQLDRSAGFLTGARADASTVRALVTSATRRLYGAWPAELPTAVGHGDFTAQNVFVAHDGRITIFDPLPVWRVCVYEDLARLTMGLRLLAPQAVSHGRLLGADLLDRWESRLLHAYAGGARSHRDLLRVYQAVLLLDRWCQLVSKQPARGRARRGVRRALVRVSGSWFEQEATRLTALLH
jgi:hypothetical protein